VLDVPLGLLGAHVGRRPQRAARQRLGRPAGRRRDQRPLAGTRTGVGPAGRLGQAPVDYQRLAVLADDDVPRLDVAVQHAPRMRVADRVADVSKAAQELP
jgi:hypothetical protein